MFEQMYIAEMLQKQREVEMKNSENLYIEESIVRKPAKCRLFIFLQFPKCRCE